VGLSHASLTQELVKKLFRKLRRALLPIGSHSIAHLLDQAQVRSASSRAVLTGRGSSPHSPTQLSRASTHP